MLCSHLAWETSWQLSLFCMVINTPSQQNVLFLLECIGKENAETIEKNGQNLVETDIMLKVCCDKWQNKVLNMYGSLFGENKININTKTATARNV